MFGGHTDIGIDLGTANILVYVKGKGIVLNEPSVVAVEKAGNKILAVGAEARDMLGRTPQGIVAVRPLKEGVIANYTITQKMLEYIINKVAGKSFFFKPRVMTCIPVHITSVEKRAVLEATIQAGVSKTYLIEEPLAAALGAGLDIMVPSGKMVVDIGGGTTDIGILSLGGVVDSDSVRVGGDKFDESIVRYVKKEYKILFILFAFNILTIYIFSNYLINDIGIKIYLIGFNYFSLYTIYCIFIESSFDSKYLQLLQIKLGSFISIISFLGLTSVALIYFFYQFIIYRIPYLIAPLFFKNFKKCNTSFNCPLFHSFIFHY